ncbi:unnamed protein product [Heligmosomoides polygyrus]|uniref:Transferrin-like domain-containing protein n=1 Tax=Heligmosomoides polygyrus TaxID=6339 RepID=A0A183FA33_HELPZ|nr:unnamed protein product [Heligmosomoides polygyrus]
MIRWKSIKSSLLFGSICFILLLLNKRLVEFHEKQEGSSYLDDVDRATRNRAMAESACDPSVIAEVDKLQKAFNRARCSANNGKEMTCMRDENEYYFPFSFIKKQYDVSGRMSKDGSRFELFTSYSKIRVPEGDSYDPIGPFGHFATYSVETRERVRCISAETGIPMSTQWNATPYYYPIQIAQYGLQHYSRMMGYGWDRSRGRNSEDVTETSSNVHQDSETMPKTSSKVPGGSEDVPKTSSIVLKESKDAHQTSSNVCSDLGDVPKTSSNGRRDSEE